MRSLRACKWTIEIEQLDEIDRINAQLGCPVGLISFVLTRPAVLSTETHRAGGDSRSECRVHIRPLAGQRLTSPGNDQGRRRGTAH